MDAALFNIHFTYPVWLYLLPVTLLALAVGLWRWPNLLSAPSSLLAGVTRHTYRHPQFAQLKMLSALHPAQRPLRHWLIRFLGYAVLFSLMHISLAQPYHLGKQLPYPQQHRDILFIVDTSVSMVLRDYQIGAQRVDRISMLKDVMQHFVKALQGNRIGIIAFSEQAYYYTPLTQDYALLQHQIQRLQPAVLTGRTSDITRALLYSLRWAMPEENSAELERPVLVLISAAQRPDRTIDPRAAAAYLAANKIRVHTIAIGSGSQIDEQQDNQSLVYQPTSFYLLQGIAEAGQGRFFWAKDKDSLDNALKVINQGERRRVDSEPEFIRRPLYMWPLLSALLWLSLWQGLALFKGRR